ncbi:MAG: hypothetical protein AB7J13_10640 [Pyrinomonadaceae bacterium]
MRLVFGEPYTYLFLNDGGHYIFLGVSATPFEFRDRHGNRSLLTEQQTTDTIGRVINNPIPLPYVPSSAILGEQPVGTQNLQYPGTSGPRPFQLVWSPMDTVLDTGETLRLLGGHNCQPSPAQPVSNALFPSLGFVACGGNLTANPVVLEKVVLPDNSSYRFKYNSFGEITRIDYPTGGFERFEYVQIFPLGEGYSPNNAANRGVRYRWISTGSSEYLWQYQAVRGTGSNPTYVVTTTAPDGSYTEQFLQNPVDSEANFGFAYPQKGRSYDERSYGPGGTLYRRQLTEWSQTGVGGLGRDVRPTKRVSVIFEPGHSSALATLTETIYDSHSDPLYFAEINPKVSKTYNYVSVAASVASSATLATAIGWFASSSPARTVDNTYLYSPNYRDRNITGVVTQTSVFGPTGEVARTQTFYDEAGQYVMLTDVTASNWENPATTYRAFPTTVRSWNNVSANQYIDTHAQYDQLGNLRKAWDSKGYLSQSIYSSAYDHAYLTETRTPIPDSSGSQGANYELVSTTSYDFNTGLVTSTADPNNATTSISYDALLRPTFSQAQNGQQTITEYGAGIDASSRWVKVRSQIDSTYW